MGDSPKCGFFLGTHFAGSDDPTRIIANMLRQIDVVMVQQAIFSNFRRFGWSHLTHTNKMEGTPTVDQSDLHSCLDQNDPFVGHSSNISSQLKLHFKRDLVSDSGVVLLVLLVSLFLYLYSIVYHAVDSSL